MKYRLTITQTTTKKCVASEETYNDRQSITYESTSLNDLLFIIQNSENTGTVGIEYKIEKVVEE